MANNMSVLLVAVNPRSLSRTDAVGELMMYPQQQVPEHVAPLVPKNYGECIDQIIETPDGKMWAVEIYSETLATQINFCPFTGRPAKVKIDDNAA